MPILSNADKVEALKLIIERYDHYYDSINNKGNLYLTINTFILGGCIAGYYTLNQSCHFSKSILLFYFIPGIIFNLISFTHTLWAVRPFAKKINRGNSLIFFADVQRNSLPEWKNRWSKLTEDDWEEELQCQSHELATGLCKKFTRLSRATLFIWLQVVFIFLFAIYLLFKFQ